MEIICAKDERLEHLELIFYDRGKGFLVGWVGDFVGIQRYLQSINLAENYNVLFPHEMNSFNKKTKRKTLQIYCYVKSYLNCLQIIKILVSKLLVLQLKIRQIWYK